MRKLQYLAITTVLSIFSLQIAILQANATENLNYIMEIASTDEYIIAQQKSNKDQKLETKDLLNQTKIKNLQKENINIESHEDIEKIRKIINDRSLGEDEIIKALKKQNYLVKKISKP